MNAIKDFTVQDFIDAVVSEGCNKDIAARYRLTDDRVTELVTFAIGKSIPYNEIVMSIAVLFNLTPDHAKIVVNNRISK